jgi:hypothetical protein
MSKEQGGILIESLIGLLILGLIGGGIMHSTARMTVAQHDMAVHNIAINQMRSMLMTGKNGSGGDVCTTAPSMQLPGSQDPVNITVKGCAAAPMTINGITIDGAALAAQTVNAMRPRVFEVGRGDELVRIGGKMNEGM